MANDPPDNWPRSWPVEPKPWSGDRRSPGTWQPSERSRRAAPTKNWWNGKRVAYAVGFAVAAVLAGTHFTQLKNLIENEQGPTAAQVQNSIEHDLRRIGKGIAVDCLMPSSWVANEKFTCEIYLPEQGIGQTQIGTAVVTVLPDQGNYYEWQPKYNFNF